jgi:hypothetical protein
VEPVHALFLEAEDARPCLCFPNVYSSLQEARMCRCDRHGPILYRGTVVPQFKKCMSVMFCCEASEDAGIASVFQMFSLTVLSVKGTDVMPLWARLRIKQNHVHASLCS